MEKPEHPPTAAMPGARATGGHSVALDHLHCHLWPAATSGGHRWLVSDP